jgi:tRNA A37 threonylcarbamoyladenosine biosynthesis protein TsaE
MVDDYYRNHWLDKTKSLVEVNLLPEQQGKNLAKMVASPDGENTVLATEIMRLKISEALIEGLNQDQLKAFVEIIDFFNNSEKDAVVLKGYAGTGKTYLVKRVIEYIVNAYPKRKIAITAPTNKAVHVLSNNSPYKDRSAVFEDTYKYDKDALLQYSTIHKLLGLKEQISNNGEQKFVPGKDINLNAFKYLIVDEVSMLNDDLFKLLIEYKDTIKIIFMGDPAQIPPIKKEYCIPFNENAPYNFRKLELREIMRQKGDHPIVDASMILRDNLLLPKPLDCVTKIVDGNGIIRINSVTERHMIRELVCKYFKSQEYALDTDHVKIIAWTNKAVNYLNDIVRQELYGEDKKAFNVGDSLVANKALFARLNNKWGGQEYKIAHNTSDEFIIESVTMKQMSFSEGHRTSPVINFTGNFYALKCKCVDGSITTLHVLKEESLTEFNQIRDELFDMAKKIRKTDYWVMYYNMLKWTDNVVHNYAITAHKSQGSTYDNVILIEEDINKNHKVKERNRIKYTAYTRARYKMYVLL